MKTSLAGGGGQVVFDEEGNDLPQVKSRLSKKYLFLIPARGVPELHVATHCDGGTTTAPMFCTKKEASISGGSKLKYPRIKKVSFKALPKIRPSKANGVSKIDDGQNNGSAPKMQSERSLIQSGNSSALSANGDAFAQQQVLHHWCLPATGPRPALEMHVFSIP